MTGPVPDERLSPGVRLWAAFVAVVIPPLLWVVSFEKLVSILERGRPAFPDISRGFGDSELAAWVDELLRGFRGPWHHTCLKRSAVLFYLLRSAGRPIQLAIGVSRSAEGGFEAHAWLLHDGALYLEPDPSVPARHRVIARFPTDADGTSP